MSRVSIAIPVFNGERFIGEAIESALRQDLDNLDLVICDNASTDRTLDVARSFSGDSRIRIHAFDRHVSIADNFNRSLDLCKGDFVRLLCHDDLLEPMCMSATAVALAEHEQAVFVTSYETTFGVRRDFRGSQALGPGRVMDGKLARDLIVRRGNWIGGPSAVTIRKSAIRGNLFNSNFLCCFDVAAWLELATRGSLIVLPDVLFHSRIHSGQATRYCEKGGFRREWGLILRECQLEASTFRDKGMVTLAQFSNLLMRICAH